MEETMPVDRPEIGGHAGAGAAQSGFTDDAFNARYTVGQPARLGSGGNGAAGPQTKPARPRSRNSYMRARARRLAASAPS
jgi:hypothetical protein